MIYKHTLLQANTYTSRSRKHNEYKRTSMTTSHCTGSKSWFGHGTEPYKGGGRLVGEWEMKMDLLSSVIIDG